MKDIFKILTIMLLLVGCQNHKNQAKKIDGIDQIVAVTCLDPESIDENHLDSVLLKIKHFQVNKKLYPILDSIINSVNKCMKYNKYRKGFVFRIDEQENKINIVIQNHYIKYIDLTQCNGIFFYKNYPFIYKGLKDTNLIIDKNETIEYYSTNPNLLKGRRLCYGENYFSFWSYIVEKKDFKCDAYNNCGEIWCIEK